ncbi:hypothetical protein MMC30_004006 [Trapelia coarctata]|nr:hypothetical protein [Trapelia coarctata]
MFDQDNFDIPCLEKVLVNIALTPALQNRLQNTIKILSATRPGDAAFQSSALMRSSNRATTAFIQKIRTDLEDHWHRIYRDMGTAAVMFSDLKAICAFLTGKLLEDYNGQSYVVSDWILNMGRITMAPEHRAIAAKALKLPEADLDQYYESHVHWPIQEMMIDPFVVREKMRVAVRRGGKRGSELNPLVEYRAWDALAHKIRNDTALIEKLQPQLLPAHQKLDIGDMIRNLQRKHFTSLEVGSTSYVLSSITKPLPNTPMGEDAFGDAPPAYNDAADNGRWPLVAEVKNWNEKI